jgi:hypothetical protein
MRAWGGNDRKVIRKLLSRRFRLVIGAPTPVLLDRKSLADAVGERWRLSAFRFSSAPYTREVEGLGLFAAEVELEGQIDGADLSGRWWMSDIWRKSGLTRNWQLLDRQLSRPEPGQAVPSAVRTLQLWR